MIEEFATTAPVAGELRHVPKPWGHEPWFAVTEHYAGKLMHVSAGHDVVRHEDRYGRS